MSTPSDKLVQMALDLAEHSTTILKVLMTAAAYKLYTKLMARDPNAARELRQQLPQLASQSADGAVHGGQIRTTVLSRVDEQENNIV